MYLFYVTTLFLTTRSAIVLHVSVLCDNIFPHYSQCYSITCICSMWQKCIHTTHSAIVLHVSVLCVKNCPHYSQCYSTTCICSMWQKLSSLLAVLLYYMYLFYVTKFIHTTRSAIVLHVSVLCDKNCLHYSQCYIFTCICALWQHFPSLLAVL
jgi:hypothetical protein